MGPVDRQYLDGFATAAQTIAADKQAFTLAEIQRAFGYAPDQDHGRSRGDYKGGGGCCAWLAGFDAGVRSAYGH